jgi:SAM-dependent methyltransferase
MDKSLYDEMHRVEMAHWWFRARRKIVWSLVDRYMAAAKETRLRICELGCGTGGNIIERAKQHDVVGIEYSQHALRHAQSSLGARVRYGCLPNDVDAPRESFDVVLLTDVLEHIENDAASAKTALSLLKPGGIVVSTVPAYQWLFAPRDAHHHHFRRYGKRQFAKLWSGGDSHIRVLSHYNSLLFPPAAAVRLASKIAGSREVPGDLKVPGKLLNEGLYALMSSERHLLGRMPVPFGLSLIAVVQKREASTVAMRRAA